MIEAILMAVHRPDALSMIMIFLVLTIGLCVALFSRRYLDGDHQYQNFFLRLMLLIFFVCVMVSANQLWIIFLACIINHYLLVRLMIHKTAWRAALNGGLIAARVFALNAGCLALGFILLRLATGSSEVSVINTSGVHSSFITLGLIAILMAAMMQSAIWPFHRWLISSMNAPTPVSAMMHAGLINGGGFMLVRFAPLILQQPMLLQFIFVVGLLTATLGTLWKLMQSDVKRLLACSTVGQMGFMFMQCGLGLFPLALAHLVWHGFFKARLLLQSASVVKEERYELNRPPRWDTFLLALLCGFIGSLVFGELSHKSWFSGDTTLVLMVVALIVCTQFALPLLSDHAWRRFPLVLPFIMLVGGLYGASVELIVWAMAPMHVMQPQPLHFIYGIGIVCLVSFWLLGFCFIPYQRQKHLPSSVLKAYVRALNASQAYPSTVTAHRGEYRYE